MIYIVEINNNLGNPEFLEDIHLNCKLFRIKQCSTLWYCTILA